MNGFPFEVEHLRPRAHGGGDEADNLALACRACNVFKSHAILATDPDTGQLVPVFNPRQGEWADHFEVGADNRILGIAPVGRATVVRLNLNADRQVLARGAWRALNLIP